METTPLISVIVPIYKIPEYLDRCIQSICEQTYTNLEIILVEDGSPDRCPELCDQWQEKDSRIRVIHKHNGGLSDARNAGVRIAKGAYISFIDGDDWIEKDFFSVLKHVMDQYRADISEVGYRFCFEGMTYERTFPEYKSIVMNRDEAMEKLIENRIPQVVWNKLYKKEIVSGIQFEVGKYHEDEFWTYQVIDKVNTYVRCDYLGYNYFQRKSSIMGMGYSLKRLDAIEAKIRRQSYLETSANHLADIARRNLLFTCLYHGQCAQKDLSGEEQKNALTFLKTVFCSQKMSTEEYRKMRLSQQFWVRMGNLSFKLTCDIRNILRIGL